MILIYALLVYNFIMKKTKNLLIKSASLLSALLLVTSCDLFGTPVNDDGVELDIKDIALINKSSEFDIKATTLKTYFYKGGNVPLVDFKEYVNTLEGFVKNQGLSWNLSKNGNYEEVYYKSYGFKYYLKVNWEKNLITISDLGVTSHNYPYAETDYGSHLKYTGGDWSSQDLMEFDLNEYDMDILYVNGKVLIPQSIINIFYGSDHYQNVIYNGDSFIFTDGPSLSDLESSKNGTTCPTDVREASVGTFLFTLDYFYGLKSYKGISSFKSFIGNELLQKLKSNDPSVYFDAYYEILQKKLNEFHTNIMSGSVYHPYEFTRTINLNDSEKSGSNWINDGAVTEEIKTAYATAFGEDESIVRYQGNTAMITFHGFTVAPTSEIKNSDGSYKDDAYTKDTYALFLKTMNEIKNKGGVKNVILDVTLNGGGNVGSMYEVLGFLTNQDLTIYGSDTLNNFSYLNCYAVDTDNDGDFEDDDAFTDFKYSILTSHYTFSAANDFAAIAKNMGIAKIIGQRSGGGMCSVLPCVLPDGTYYRISSNNQGNMYINDELVEIESGIAPDTELTMDQMFDLEYLNTLVNA